MRNDGRTKVHWVPVSTPWLRWYTASIRHDYRELGVLGGEETAEETEILKQGPPSTKV